MTETIAIKRDWDDAVIKVKLDLKEIIIECPIEAFERRLTNLLLRDLPSLTWDFKRSTIHEKVKQAFHEAFEKTTKEMKEETIKITAK